jgi:hypothetical protein
MPTTRFERKAPAQLLVAGCAIVFGACVLSEHAQAQPYVVPPPAKLPPPVLNPSNPGTVPQPSYTPATPTTPSTVPSSSAPSTVPSVERTSPANEESPSTAAQSEREASVAKTRAVHHHRRGRSIVEPTLGSYYCGYSPCVRIRPWAFYGYAAPAYGYAAPAYAVVAPPPIYAASTLWWPGYYDYAPGQFGRAAYLGRGYRPAGYHGD